MKSLIVISMKKKCVATILSVAVLLAILPAVTSASSTAVQNDVFDESFGIFPHESIENPESISEYIPAAEPYASSASMEESAPQSPFGTITIKGRWLYTNENNVNVPMRQVRVELWEDETLKDTLVTWQYTSYSGYYSFTVNNDDGPFEGGRDPYVKVVSDSVCAYCKNSSGSYYTVTLPKCGNNVPDGFTYDYGTRWPTANNRAWQAIDACLSERDWIWYRSSPNWQRPTKVEIRWPYETGAHSHGNNIHLPSTGWNHVTVHHEYAHTVMYALYGHFPPGSGGPHNIWSEKNPGFAIAEGWAEFMQCVVDYNVTNLQGWNSGHGGPSHGGNIETNDWYNCTDDTDMDGEIVEGSSASILWDIYDPTSTADYDYLSMGFDEIFTVMSIDQPDNMTQFWTAWKIRWSTLSTSVGPLCTIYWHYGIDKDVYAPYGGYISINAGAVYTKSIYVTLTLSCKDWGSGVAYMRFRNSVYASWSAWYPYATSKSWNLSTGDGLKYVYVQFKDKKGYSTGYYDTITLDTTPPKVTNVSVYPTKFNPKLGWVTRINFTLSEPCYVTILIKNSAGVTVRTLLNNALLTSGSKSVVWNGKNDAGSIVPVGTYYVAIGVVDRAGNKASPYPIVKTVTVSY